MERALADDEKNTRDTSQDTDAADPRAGLRGKLSGLSEWVLASKLRKILAGVGAFVTLVGLFATWSYVGHIAVLDDGGATLDMALEALDRHDYEEARQMVGEMKQRPGDTSDFGGYLFILGAVKSSQADMEWSEERRRATHLVAARYLQKSRELGAPPGRESQLMYLLGQSLIHANQPKAGIKILKESLRDIEQPPHELHRLLASAYLNLPTPNLSSALHHIQQLAGEKTLSEDEHLQTLLTEADILIRLSRIAEAIQVFSQLPEGQNQQATRLILEGRIQLAEAQQLDVDSPQRTAQLESALELLQEAQRVDSLNGKTTRQAMVLVGQCYELLKNKDAAMAEYEHISNSYGDTPESVVATLAKARLLQAAGEPDKSLVAFRSVIESAGDPLTYANPLLTLADLRRELLAAHSRFLEKRQFQQALVLIDHFAGLFGPATVAEFTALTHHAWAESNLEEAQDTHRRRSAASLQSEGRYHYRASGRAYETLSELRPTSRKFSDDLWAAAENYFLGQSYSHAAKVLNQYLLLEARSRRALALLRYGQCELAVGNTADAVLALQECIEMHPRDANVFAARVECANAYLTQKQPDKAEAMLLENLTGDTLRPASPEWRDSLFLLGNYLHDQGRYVEAIEKLQEAVARYPDAQQTLLARYTIARSYHSAAEEPAKLALQAKTENERQKNRRLRDVYWEEALMNYQDVQRRITLEGHAEDSALTKALLRNCYMMQGAVLFELRRYEDARKAYANVSTIYQHEPFVLESFVHIANCWHRLNQPVNARQTIAQAKLVLERLSKNIDFKQTTNFSRQQWQNLLNEMSKW